MNPRGSRAKRGPLSSFELARSLRLLQRTSVPVAHAVFA
jgi:hypothetical protein